MAKVVPARSLPDYMSRSLPKLFQLFQKSLQFTTAKTPKPTTTLTKQINIVNDMIYQCFCHKIIMFGKNMLFLPSKCTHRNIHVHRKMLLALVDVISH